MDEYMYSVAGCAFFFLNNYGTERSRDNSIDMALGYGLGDRGSILGRG
jgi:hypothetical protein